MCSPSLTPARSGVNLNMKDQPTIPVFGVPDGPNKLTLYDRIEEAQKEAQSLNAEIKHLKCAPRLFDEEGGFPVVLHRPTDDDEPYGYEPEYKSPERVRARLRHMYRVSARFRTFSDALWAKGQATSRAWKEAAEREQQMRLPLPEFCPWMRDLGKPNPWSLDEDEK